MLTSAPEYAAHEFIFIWKYYMDNVVMSIRLQSMFSDFVGEFCDTSLDDCASVSCANGGECVDAINTYYCECPIGKSGIDCDKGTKFKCGANYMV